MTAYNLCMPKYPSAMILSICFRFLPVVSQDFCFFVPSLAAGILYSFNKMNWGECGQPEQFNIAYIKPSEFQIKSFYVPDPRVE